MITTRSRSHTFALRPNFSWKMPIVPGPHTSCVMRMSTSTHTLSLGLTWLLPVCLARIFSVMVMPGIDRLLFQRTGEIRPTSIAGRGFADQRTGGADEATAAGDRGTPVHLFTNALRTGALGGGAEARGAEAARAAGNRPLADRPARGAARGASVGPATVCDAPLPA